MLLIAIFMFCIETKFSVETLALVEKLRNFPYLLSGALIFAS